MGYEVDTWQALIQQCVYYLSHGYAYYCKIPYPERKQERFLKIDEKLASKYRVSESKYVRARAKAKGYAQYVLVRHGNQAVLFKTPGQTQKEIIEDDLFVAVSRQPLSLYISENLTLEVYKDALNGKVSARMNRESYHGIRDLIRELLRARKGNEAIHVYNKLNGIPAWAGVIAQKARLRNWLPKYAKRHGIKIDPIALRLNTRRKIYKKRKNDAP